MVFDNLKINENKKVQDLLDWEYNGNVIFCSQDIEAFPYTIAITTLTNKDSLTLVGNLLESKDKGDSNFLVKAFSGYPILIVQGTQLLNQIKGMDKENYKKRIYQSAEKIKLNVKFTMEQLTHSACQLLSKIALINSKNFSKDLLKIITDFPNNLDNDILQLTKFMLITCIDSNEANPIFEMHDVIAQKTIEINENQQNKKNLESVIDKIAKNIPNNGRQLGRHTFRSGETINDNLKVIFDQARVHNISIYKLLPLNCQLFINYINMFQFYEAERLFNWFDELDKKNRFNLWLMDNDTRLFYARYLAIIGGYYKTRFVNWYKALEYYLRAEKVLEKVEGHQAIKCNFLYNTANAYVSLGQIREAQNIIDRIERNAEFTSLGQVVRIMKSRLYYYIGNYRKALEESEKEILQISKSGIKQKDVLYLTNNYILKAEILNALGRYQEAYAQVEELYQVHKSVTKADNEVWGRVYTQMAKAELGLGDIDKASDHINKALAIFLADEKRNPKNGEVSEDPDLAASYVARGDILTARENFKEAIESYRDAQKIYFYLYKNNSGNVAQVSDLYLKGAKVSCKLKDLYHYKAFGLPQVREFGNEHPNTIIMFEYCKQYDMDLWRKEN